MVTPDLGPLEMKVLGLLDGKGPKAVADIQQELLGAGDDLAYTTVMTVLTRLHQKGVVRRTKESRRYLYALAPGARAVERGVLARLRDGLFRKDRLRPIVALIQEDDLSRDELRTLRRMIDDKIKDKASR